MKSLHIVMLLGDDLDMCSQVMVTTTWLQNKLLFISYEVIAVFLEAQKGHQMKEYIQLN